MYLVGDWKMPITSVDIPSDIMEYVNSLFQNGKANTIKALITDLLRFHQKFSMSEWTDNIIYFYGLRHAFISQRSMSILIQNIKEEEQYEVGKKMGRTWVDAHFARYGTPISRETWPQALKILEDSGWGSFDFDGTKIVVKRPFLPLLVLQGYLEAGLEIKLERLTTTDQIGVFKINETS
jgi:hypothetical protein